jgi:hypothetical protein
MNGLKGKGKELEVLVRRQIGNKITDAGGFEIPNLTYVSTKYVRSKDESIQQMAEREAPEEADSYLINLPSSNVAILGVDQTDLNGVRGTNIRHYDKSTGWVNVGWMRPAYEIVYFRKEPIAPTPF